MTKRDATIYFCDEAGTKERLTAVAGLAISLRDAIEVEKRLKMVRAQSYVSGELKWSNAKQRRDSPHRSYAHLLRQLYEEGKVDFHINFFPMSHYQHRISGERGKIDTISKQCFNLLLHRAARFYGGGSIVHIRPDDGEYTSRLPEFLSVLNAKAYDQYELTESIGTIRRCKSCEAHFLQLLDITLGAMTAVRNARYRGNFGSFKAELSREIWHLWGAPDLSRNSFPGVRRFNVWNVMPSL